MSFRSWLRPRRRPLLETLEDRTVPALAAADYAVGANPQAILLADFDGDDKLDLAAANASDNTVSVLLGRGDGTFGGAIGSAAGTAPVSLASGDFNDDGKLDLVAAGSGGLSVLLGNGDGSFQSPSTISLGSTPASVAVGDFNGDGKLDLAATSSYQGPGYWGWYGYYPGPISGEATVLLGDGSGSFSSAGTAALGSGLHAAAVAADFNGDGDLDFAAVNSDYATAVILLGDGTGSLGSPSSYNTGWYPRAMTAGDFTGDGKFDLAAVGQTVDILPGNGDGTFQGVVRQYIDPVAVAAADFNGDGDLDLVTADPWAGVVIHLGRGDGSLSPPIRYSAGTGPAAVAAGDFNGDGRQDVAVASSGSGTVSVLLNNGTWPAPDAPSASISDAEVVEGHDGTATATFTVTLSAAYGQPVQLRYATADGSATADADYRAATGTLTFAAGTTSQTFTLQVNGDRVADPYEYFNVLLESDNTFIADGVGYGNITDDEPLVSVSGAAVTEGNTGTRDAVFTVGLDRLYDIDVKVSWSTADGSAAAGSDYQQAGGEVTIRAGQLSETVKVLITGDRVAEQTEYVEYDWYGWGYSYFRDDEYFYVNLSGSDHAAVSGGQGTGTIFDDEPRVSIGGATVTEGNTGTKAMTFTVSLAAAYDAPVTVSYATADGSALAGSDYQAKSGTVTFAANTTTQTVTVQVIGDRAFEYDETFYVNLTGAGAAVISNGTGYGTIQDDEPRISISGASVKEGHSGTRVMSFTVTLAAAYDQTVTVKYATQDGTAKVSDNDYVAASGTLTFAPGETTKTINVVIKGDKRKESNEYFSVVLSGASSNAQIANAIAWGDILDDDRR